MNFCFVASVLVSHCTINFVAGIQKFSTMISPQMSASQRMSPIFSPWPKACQEILDTTFMKTWPLCITRWSHSTSCLLEAQKCISKCLGLISFRLTGGPRVLDRSTCFLTLRHSWTNIRPALAFAGWWSATLLSRRCTASTFLVTALRTLRVSGDSICSSCSCIIVSQVRIPGARLW